MAPSRSSAVVAFTFRSVIHPECVVAVLGRGQGLCVFHRDIQRPQHCHVALVPHQKQNLQNKPRSPSSGPVPFTCPFASITLTKGLGVAVRREVGSAIPNFPPSVASAGLCLLNFPINFAISLYISTRKTWWDSDWAHAASTDHFRENWRPEYRD